jgi:hypothetical protein
MYRHALELARENKRLQELNADLIIALHKLLATRQKEKWSDAEGKARIRARAVILQATIQKKGVRLTRAGAASSRPRKRITLKNRTIP